MRLRTRVPVLGAALVVALGAVTAFAPGPASALTQKRITLTRAHPVFEGDYGPIPASFEESTSVVTPTPSGCGNDDGVSDAENPPPFAGMCDRVPLRVVVPTDLDPGDDFVVSVLLTWEDAPGKGAGAEGTVTDLDLHFYDNKQIEQREDPESESFTEITSSAGATIPESIKICCPDLVDYNIVVVNAGAGANSSGYHIRAEMKILKADKIFELLAEPPAPSRESSSTTEDTLPEDLSNLPLLAPGLNDINAPEFDGDLSDLHNAPLEAALQAPFTGDETLVAAKPGPVSGVTLALWLSIMPLGVIGTLAGFAWRRRNAAVSLI